MDHASEPECVDLVIIGGGPTGLFAAFYAGLRGMSTRIVDSLEVLGGQLATLYPEKFIYDVGGFPAVLAKTLVAELTKQATQYHPEVFLNERALELVQRDSGLLELRTDRRVHLSRTVLIAAGAGAFTPKRLPQPEYAVYEGHGLHYVVRDPADFRGKQILVIGGGDSAVDWALHLARVAERVTLIHRRDVFRAHEDSVGKLEPAGVVVRPFHELRTLGGTDGVEFAVIYDNRSGAEQRLSVDAVVVNIGFVSTLGPVRNWGLELDREGVVVDSRMRTSMPGVFAAGDLASYPGKLKLIATGFGEAAIAVNHAKVHIDPASKAFPGHSTTLVPKQRRRSEAHE